jgi:hypothetical protein
MPFQETKLRNIVSGLRGILAFTALILFSRTSVAQVQLNACDLNADGVVNSADVTAAVNMDLGLMPCTANVTALGTCSVVVVQRVTNAALGQACSAAGSPHSVTLNWTPSTTPDVSYNVYRSSTAGGPYSKIGSAGVGIITYTDNTALAGYTYYYVTTAVDSNNNESAFSNQATGAIPFP